MNKKGDVHVDWIISAGIFILAVVAIFVFFRPLDVKEVDKTVLLKTVIDGFNRDFKWEVKTTPLFVKTCQQYANPTPPPAVLDASIVISLENEWQISKLFYRGTDEQVEVSGAPGTINCDQANEASEIRAGNSFYIEDDDQAVFLITYKNVNLNLGRANARASCNPNDSINCEITLGRTDSFSGVNENLVSQLGTGAYDETSLRSSWNFPDKNDFWIESDDLTINFKTAEPYEQADIVVKVEKTFKVDGTGTRIPTDIIFRVW